MKINFFATSQLEIHPEPFSNQKWLAIALEQSISMTAWSLHPN